MKLLLQCTDVGLIPLYNSDLDVKKQLKIGETYEATIIKPRNIAFHRKFFALINMVYENQEVYTSIDHLRRDLTIASGFYEQHKTFTGQTRTEPKSISFANMKQEDFDKLYSAFIVSIGKYFDFSESDIKDNIQQFY